jgi:hypothetical protein
VDLPGGPVACQENYALNGFPPMKDFITATPGVDPPPEKKKETYCHCNRSATSQEQGRKFFRKGDSPRYIGLEYLAPEDMFFRHKTAAFRKKNISPIIRRIGNVFFTETSRRISSGAAAPI